MRIFKKCSIVLLIMSIMSLFLNFLGPETEILSDSETNYATKQDTVNIIIALNWTGSIMKIGGTSPNSPNYREQLKGLIKDSLKTVIENIKKDKFVNLTYCFFGLTIPQNRSGSNADFEKNYIKTYKKDQENFRENDWSALIDNIKSENCGYFTALTVARELATVLTSNSKVTYDENYLIFVSDNFFNVGAGKTYTQEIEELSNWSSSPRRADYERIKNFNIALDITSKLNKYYEFNQLKNIEILPRGISIGEPHFRIELHQIMPKIIYDPKHFIQYPKKIVCERISTNEDRIPLNISYINDKLNESLYTPQQVIFTLIGLSSNKQILYQEIYPSTELPNELLVPSQNRNSFYLELRAYYDYNDEEIFPCYIEQHRIIIPCEYTRAGKLAFIWPVQGRLLNFHNSIGIFKGQIAVANFWNIILILTIIVWTIILAIPRVIPPAPEVKYTLKPGE